MVLNMEHFKKYFMVYTVLPLLMMAIVSSYYRFIVSYDYEVVFEGYCDPYTESCFEFCEDEECTEPFHYTWFARNAADLRSSCGDLSILDCEFAEDCSEGEMGCYATYCDPNVDFDCEFLTEDDFVEEQVEATEELEFEEIIDSESTDIEVTETNEEITNTSTL